MDHEHIKLEFATALGAACSSNCPQMRPTMRLRTSRR